MIYTVEKKEDQVSSLKNRLLSHDIQIVTAESHSRNLHHVVLTTTIGNVVSVF